jgi:hypothetical protein
MEMPATVTELLQLRDANYCKKSCSHTSLICVLCGLNLCKDCSSLSAHITQHHLIESLFFNLETGGFIFYHIAIELNIRSFYVNPMGKVWKPEFECREFGFDRQLYQQMWHEFKRGNIFYFLSHNFEGLKGMSIPDIV